MTLADQFLARAGTDEISHLLGDSMNFVDAVKTVLTINYANFNSRSARSEYWWWVLFSVIVAVIFYFLVMAVPGIRYLQMIYSLAVLIPSLAVAVRRLHDIDKSGWWILIGLIPIIGWIVLIYWYIQEGTRGDNQYGPPAAA
jgi:uncharacterized membrane protein YhaH (DUF805 family)